MTKEEIVDALLEDMEMPYLQDWQARDIVDFVIKNYQPSLPSNLDEAAEEYEHNLGLFEHINLWPITAFKAGAEWMAGQGEIHETEIVSRINASGLLPAVTCLVDNSYKEGDKVVVQIRKK